jgi:hypothetical protein
MSPKSFHDKVLIRSQLIRDKQFLLKLFQKDVTAFASAKDFQMNTVIRIIHLIFTNVIPLKERNFTAVKNSKKFKLLETNFKSTNNFLKTLQLASEEKRNLLKQFTGCYPYLFHSIFVE